MTIPAVEPIKVVAAIVKAEMSLAIGQIMLGLENWIIPKNGGIYVALSYGPETVVSNWNGNTVDTGGEFVEVQQAVMLHQIDIDVMSFDSSARTRKEEVLWALASVRAQQAMETYGMRFGTTPSAFVAIPSLEETKQLNRFRSSFMVNALHSNTKAADYYDTLAPLDVTFNA